VQWQRIHTVHSDLDAVTARIYPCWNYGAVATKFLSRQSKEHGVFGYQHSRWCCRVPLSESSNIASACIVQKLLRNRLVKEYRSRIVFGSYSLRISAWTQIMPRNWGCGFPRSLQKKPEILPWLYDNRFREHPFQLISHAILSFIAWIQTSSLKRTQKISAIQYTIWTKGI
jgi:hypothetical protein